MIVPWCVLALACPGAISTDDEDEEADEEEEGEEDEESSEEEEEVCVSLCLSVSLRDSADLRARPRLDTSAPFLLTGDRCP